MPRFDAMCGGDNTTFSPNIASEFCMNWIPEKNAVSVQDQGTDVTDKNIRCSLNPTPGLAVWTTLLKSPVRGVFPGEYRMFAVGGDSFYEVFEDGSNVDRSIPGFSGSSGIGPEGGVIGNDNQPVQCFWNGNQALIISAGQAYCDNGNGPVACQFSDPLTDLMIDPSNAALLTTPTGGNFDQSDVGRTVQITGGAGFNVGMSQVIISVTADGGAIGASNWGVSGSSLGTGIEFLGMVSYTDLHLQTPGFIVSSAASPFSASEVGLTLTITGGSGFAPGNYTITGLQVDESGNPTGAAILDRPAGSGGSVSGTGHTPAMMVTASQGAFLDGYGFITPYPRTKTVYYSAIDDFTSWNPLDFFNKANYPDNVSALFADHEELYTLGDLESTQVWRDVGDADNPFQPDPGAVMHVGCQSSFSPTRLGNGVAWIGQDTRRGTRKAIYSVGYNPQVISTPAVEAQWAKYLDISDAVSFTYAANGHELWVINFPTANATWAWDSTTGFWLRWGYWNGNSWDRTRVWVHCVVALGGSEGHAQVERHFGGDWSSGNIYVMSTDYRTDNGNVNLRRRIAPHLTKENMRRFYSRFEIDCDRLGQVRIVWNRLGAGRDRIWILDVEHASESVGAQLTLSYSDDRLQSIQSFYAQSVDPSVELSLANAYLNWTDATWH